MKTIMPCLWFDKEAEEAANYYCSIFKNAELGHITRYGNEGQEIHGGKRGNVLTAEFSLDGHKFLALNGGPLFKFNEAISFQVLCESQVEVDHYWEKLSAGGDPKGSSAVGSRTSTARRGRSCRPSCPRCCRTRIGRSPIA